MPTLPSLIAVLFLLGSLATQSVSGAELKRLSYNTPGTAVDLGVGLWAWPLPMDFDGDGDNDLVVSCPDKPYNGIYFFENTEGDIKYPTFKAGKRISNGARNIHVSHVGNSSRVLTPGQEHPGFLKNGIEESVKLVIPHNFHKTTGKHSKNIRANQWTYVDFNGNGKLDLIVGIGDWSHYGWDDAYNKDGQWTHGPLHGYIYLFKNESNSAIPNYADPIKLTDTDGRIINVFGRPSPSFADFDNDGDLDLICGEFRDGFTYFQNTGTRTRPNYAPAHRLPLKMQLCMITPTPIDWDKDGDIDLIVGDEDGRVALVENLNTVHDGIPQFDGPHYFKQEAEDIKFGALATPVGFDWDGDGDDDILCGNTAGHISFIENISPKGAKSDHKWKEPKLLMAGTNVLHIQAGANGSIQGPAEAKWGYTTLTVGDWDGDQLPDLMVNSIWGKIIWYKNVGSRKKPRLAAPQPVTVNWTDTNPKPAWNWWDPEGNELVSQWRTTPVMLDWNRDGLQDLIMLDHQGYLALYERGDKSSLSLLPPKRIFLDATGKELRLNSRRAGGSGRRKIAITDWDRDGDFDLLLNSTNADFYENVEMAADGKARFKDPAPLSETRLAGHTSSPTTIDLNGNGIPDLLVGAEDGFLYHASR